MAKRSQNARDEQGTWENGGGGLKLNSTAEENVRREIQEEYSVMPNDLEFWGYRDVFRVRPDGTPTHWIALDFGVFVERAQVKINEPDKFDDSGWFKLENLPSPLHSQIERMHKIYRVQYQKILSRAGEIQKLQSANDK